MLNFTFKIDTSDVDKYFSQLEEDVKQCMDDVGRQAVEYAIEHGTYHDVTGTLRSNNKYEVSKDMLTIYNDTPYAAEVASRADVIESASLFAEAELKRRFE